MGAPLRAGLASRARLESFAAGGECNRTASDVISGKGLDNEQIESVTVGLEFQMGREDFPDARQRCCQPV